MKRNQLIQKSLVSVIILFFVVTSILPSTGFFTISTMILKDTNSDPPPEEEWTRTYPLFGHSTCIKITPDGGSIITGYTSVVGYLFSVFLLKVDNQGNEEWNRTYGEGYDIGNWLEITADTGYIIIGCWGVYGQTCDMWLLKTNENGTEEWNRTFESEGSTIGNCVKQTQDGGYIIVGKVVNNESRSVILIKTDSFGNELWRKTYGNWSCGETLDLTTDGGYIITGYDYYQMLLIKTDANGTVEWEKKFFSNAWPGSTGKEVHQTLDGGYIIGGTTSTNNLSTDLVLLKIDENGYEQWNHTFGGSGWEGGGSTIETIDGDYLLGGTQIGLQGQYPDKLRLIRMHPDGGLVWDHFFVTSMSATCNSIQQTPDTGFITTGIADWNKTLIVKISGGNQPPSSPTITGPNKGKINIATIYNFTAIDPNNDDMYYFIDWGDNSNTSWIGSYKSGDVINQSHTWSKKGDYTIKAKARDIYGIESDWGTFSVTMPYSYTIPFQPLLGELFGRFPHIFPILRHLMGY